jgi:hypothetical protein
MYIPCPPAGEAVKVYTSSVTHQPKKGLPSPQPIATIKKANNNQKQQTNGSSPKEKHKREPFGWHPGGDPNCGFSNSAGWLSSWTTFSQ